MYIIFNQDGSIKESQLNDYVNQYSDGVNFIDVVVYGMSTDDYTASATYTLPNGENLTDTGVYKSNIATSLGEMQGYRFTLHSANTQYDGPLTFSLVATKTDKTQLFTYAYEITVNPSAGKKTTEVTWEEYQSLLAQLASYQLRFSSQNVIHADLTTATGMISVMPVGQVVLVSDDDDETKQDVYVVVSDATSETGKKLQMVTLGEDGLKSAYVYKEEVLGEVQAVHTGLVSHYTDKDDENIAVRYGTDEVDVPAWFVYCLDGDKYSGNITMGAKTFNFYDAHDGDMPWLMNDGNLSKIVSPSRTSKLELETGSAKITSNTIQLGEKLAITDQGNTTNFTGAYVSFGSGTTTNFDGELNAYKSLKVNGSSESYIKSEGNANALYANGSKTEVSDPTGKHSIELNSSGTTLKGTAKVEKDPTEDLQIATKRYVDEAVATGGDVKLNIANGVGEGSLETRETAEANGVYSVAFGKAVSTSVDYSLIVGYNFNMSSSDIFAVGYEAPFFGVGANETYVNSNHFTILGVSRFDEDATFKGDVVVEGNLTATYFTAINTTSLDTERATIGLAKGNTEAISSYIGLYAEKYNGSDYGALVWDNTGTAYVGDATVDKNGKISDPSHTLQPILTRAETSLLSNGAILAWDADAMKAVSSSYFTISNGTLVIANGTAILAVASNGVVLGFGGGGYKEELQVNATGAHVVHEPTEDTGVANKKYVDDHSGSPIILRVW